MSLQAPVSADDVRDVRRVLASWTVERYTAVREEGRAKGEAPRELVTLPHNATLEEALRTLSEKRILSAPILDARDGAYFGARRSIARDGPRWTARLPSTCAEGFLGMSDILKWLLKGASRALRARDGVVARANASPHRRIVPSAAQPGAAHRGGDGGLSGQRAAQYDQHGAMGAKRIPQ